jgi:hypothetical protein
VDANGFGAGEEIGICRHGRNIDPGGWLS